MAAPKTELESYLVYGIDEKNRRVYFGTSLATASHDDEITEFTQVSVEYAIRAIERMATDYPKVPIEIHMNSFGGEVYSMFALYDVIQAATCQIKFYGKGAIMSAASWIMCSCDERYLYPNTTIMLHDGYPGISSDKSDTDVDIEMQESTRLREKLHQIYADNSRMPKNFWEEVCKRDLYLTAEEAILLGLADECVQPKRRGNLRKKRQHHLSQTIDKRRMNKMVEKLFKRIKTPTKLVIEIAEPKIEPIDEKLTIEKKPEEPIESNENVSQTEG